MDNVTLDWNIIFSVDALCVSRRKTQNKKARNMKNVRYRK